MSSSTDEILAELARLESTVMPVDEPSPQKVQQWRTLFQYSYSQAVEKIKQRTVDLGRLIISDEFWDEIRNDKEAQGFDKDAYEHFLESRYHQTKGASQQQSPPPLASGTESATYLLKLEGSLSNPQDVQALTGSLDPPEVEVDENDPTARFCRVSARERQIIIPKLPFQPTFVRIRLSSRKDFDVHSRFPTLGIDSTLPQHRLNTGEQVLPLQDQYPVWYFFYGNLAVPEILSERLCIPEEDIKLRPATISGGVVGSWGGKYRALLDGPNEATVDGFGFLVQSPEVEDTLRWYETDRYEVVRCRMTLEDVGEIVPACAFKFLE